MPLKYNKIRELFKIGKDIRWLLGTIVIICAAVIFLAEIPKNVKANTEKNKLQDEVDRKHDRVDRKHAANLNKLINSMKGFTETEKIRSERYSENRSHQSEMSRLLITMIGTNTARLNNIRMEYKELK